jgi:subtilisin family serine protease
VGLATIQAEAAWAESTGRGALIAVVDTGVDLKHPDLAKKLVVRSNADMVDPKKADGPLDENGHGTHVAGIAGAITNNGIGVAGTAPNARSCPCACSTRRDPARPTRWRPGSGSQRTRGPT